MDLGELSLLAFVIFFWMFSVTQKSSLFSAWLMHLLFEMMRSSITDYGNLAPCEDT